MRRVPDTANLFQPLESILREKFIPAITGKSSISDEDRALLALPPRLGGLGLTNPSREANHCFEASKSITEPLSHAIIQQELDTAAACLESRSTKISVAKEKRRRQAIEAETILEKLPPAKRRLMLCAKEKGASSWVTALPIDDHGFFLHKGAFRDAVCLRYGWSLQNMLADKIAEKRRDQYASTMQWIRCRLSFALVRSAIRAIRGTRCTVKPTIPLDSLIIDH